MILFISDAHAHNIPISDGILIEQAKRYGGQIGISTFEFKYSSGWLEKFKKRHNLSAKTMSGEKASSDLANLKTHRNDLTIITAQFDPNDIYNFDETALFYRLKPNRTLASCIISGSKESKDRITIGVCVNSTGTDKCKLVMIGKHEKPRCFGKNLNSSSIVRYFWNKKAWMTVEIFTKWLFEFDKRFNKKVLLLVDNASGHSVSDENKQKLKNVVLHFLPPNTTSILQPCDAGIINSLKCHYKKLLIHSYLDSIKEINKILEPTVKDAMFMIHKAWKNVTVDTIFNCWSHCQIIGKTNTSSRSITTGEESVEDTIAKGLDKLKKYFYEEHKIDADMDLQEFIDFEKGVPTGERLTTEDIVSIVLGEKNLTTTCVENDDEDDNINVETTKSYTIHDAKNCLAILQSYFEECLHFNSNDLDLLDNIKARLIEQHELNKKQVNLHMFLK